MLQSDTLITSLSELELLAAHVQEAGRRDRPSGAPASGVLAALARAAAACLRVPAAGVVLFADDGPRLAAMHGAPFPPHGPFPDGASILAPDGSVAGMIFAVDPLNSRLPDEAGRIALEQLAAVAGAHLARHAESLRLESELRDSEERYRGLYQSVPVAVYRCSAQGRLLDGNLALARMLGYDGFDELRRACPDCGFRPAIWEEIEGGESLWQHRDGNAILVREYLRLTRDGGAFCWQGAAENITAARRTEDALVETEGRFHAFMDHGPFVALIKDAQGRHVYVNRAFRDILGDDVTRLSFGGGTPWSEEVTGQLRAHDAAVISAGRSLQFIEHVPLPSGEMRHWLVQKFPFVSPSGQRLLGCVALDITDRLLTEQALRESEERLKLAQDAAGIAYWDSYPATGRTTWSAQSYRLMGIDPSVPASFSAWMGAVHPDDREAALQSVRDSAECGGEYRSEFRVVLPDGRVRWLYSLGRSHPASGPDGVRIAGITMDITAAKQAQEALRASEERFRTAAGIASDVITEWDPATGAIRFFGPVRERFELDPGNELPTTLPALLKRIHPGDRRRFAASLDRVVRAGGRHLDQIRLVLANGKVLDLEHRGTAVRDAGGTVKYIGASTCITHRKRAEEEITRLAALVQSSDDAIVALSREGAITSWNRGAERMYGYLAATVLGRPFSILFPPERVAEWAGILERVATGSAVHASDCVLVCRDGGPIPVSLAVSLIRTAQGEPAGISVIARDISQRKQVEQVLAYQAQHDQLTALPNRRLLAERMEQAIAAAVDDCEVIALYYIDLDGFKLVNDTLGHAVGDMLLQQVARRLEACVRASDTLARTGGDEFTLVAAGLGSTGDAEELAGRLLESFTRPFPVKGRNLYVSASIGVSLYPLHARSATELQQRADLAMYAAKRSGKNCSRFFAPIMNESNREQLDLANELRLAVERGQLHLHYQPQFRLAGGELSGMEALLRWTHPRLGAVPPDRFIPVAEEAGLIVAIGEWVLVDACRQIRQWEVERKPAVRVAVNVSVLQFVRPDYVETLDRILRENGVDARRLEIELTESVVLGSVEEAAEKLRRLRDLGVSIAMDDFGTGYSSLSYLQRLPIDAVKIDGSFTRDIGVTASALPLIRAIATLSHELGMRVIMEGIENEDQLAALRQIGCDEGQGYYLGRPRPGNLAY